MIPTRPWPRLCLDLTHHAWTRGDPAEGPALSLAHAEAADAAGIDAIWVSEDLEGWDAFALLGAITTRTAHAHLGTGVTTPWARHPNTLAASVATIDRLSGGRAVLGLGTGQRDWLMHGLGMEDLDPPAALTETIALLRQWWTPEQHAALPEATVFPVRGWERTVRPAQAAPPILIAATGPRAIAITATHADGIILNAHTSDTAIQRILGSVRDHRRAAGMSAEIPWVVLRTPVTLTVTPEETRTALLRQRRSLALIGSLPGMERLLDHPAWDTGAILAEVRLRLQRDAHLARGDGFTGLRRENLAAAAEAIPLALVEELGITGDLTHVRMRMSQLADFGVTHLSVAPPRRPTVGDWHDLLAGLRWDYS